MAEAINPIGNAGDKVSELLGTDYLAQASPAGTGRPVEFSGNLFEDVLAKAINALEGISHSEIYADQLIKKYMQGEVELHDVMIAQSKASIMIQLAVTTINSAVTTFKEITQMQI